MSLDHRVDLAPAFVLHQRPYRESSLLLEIFALDYGRVGLIAKGARRPRSPFRTQLVPFRSLLLSWRGRGELALLVGAETDGAALVLPSTAIISGLYVNELLVRLLHRHDPHPELFAQYRRTLSALSQPDAAVEQTLRIFEKRLLEAVGYGLMLQRTAESGGAVVADKRYRYIADLGPVEIKDKPPVAGISVSGSTLLALAAEQAMGEAALKEAKRLMRSVINVHLEGRPLVSRSLYRRKQTPVDEAVIESAASNPESHG